MNFVRETLLSVGLLILRFGIGGLMLVHGWAKVQGYEAMATKFPDPIGLGSQLSLMMAIGAEVGCSLLLIVGFLTRIAAIPLAFTMLIALLVVHASDPWNVKELSAVFLLTYVTLIFTGPGTFSVDRLFQKKMP